MMQPNKKLLSLLFLILLSISCMCISGEEEDGGTTVTILKEEEFEIGYIQSIVVETPALFTTKSTYQDISIYQSQHYGKILVLDDCLQLTEVDANSYNEMLAHVPIFEYLSRHEEDILNMSTSKKNNQKAHLNVLVLGGGDGYVVSELAKHSSSTIQTIDHVELDEEVIRVSQRFFPWAKNLYNDNNNIDENDDENLVKLHIADGASFVEERASQVKEEQKQQEEKEECEACYHVIIQDSSDPFVIEEDGETTTLPSSVLYTQRHFEYLYQLLQPTQGILLFQAETYNLPSNLQEIRQWRKMLQSIGFQNVKYGTIAVGSYPTGQIGFFMASASSTIIHEESTDPQTCSDDLGTSRNDGVYDDSNMDILHELFKRANIETKYYHPRIHRSAFDLPLWVENYIYSNTDEE